MPHTFASRLEQLFDVVRRPDGQPFSMAEVAGAVTAEGRTKLSGSYLSELRSGRKDNPNVWVADGLARFFGQPLEYFVDDELEPVLPGSRPRVEPPALLDADLHTVAGRINFLLMASQPAGGKPLDSKTVVQWINRAGSAFRAEDLDAARHGTSQPDPELLAALAAQFDVPEAFLTSEDVAVALAGDLRLLRVMRDKGLRRLAFRANTLNASDRERVADLVNRLAGGETGIAPEDLDF